MMLFRTESPSTCHTTISLCIARVHPAAISTFSFLPLPPAPFLSTSLFHLYPFFGEDCVSVRCPRTPRSAETVSFPSLLSYFRLPFPSTHIQFECPRKICNCSSLCLNVAIVLNGNVRSEAPVRCCRPISFGAISTGGPAESGCQPLNQRHSG